MRHMLIAYFICQFLGQFSDAFLVQRAAIKQFPPIKSSQDFSHRSRSVLFSEPDDQDRRDPIEESSIQKSISNEPEGTSFPIDLPSPLLLSLSMVLAIIGTGSAFDLAGGSPNLGFGPTAGVALLTIPTCLFLFYASILKATAETEADDREFMKGRY